MRRRAGAVAHLLPPPQLPQRTELRVCDGPLMVVRGYGLFVDFSFGIRCLQLALWLFGLIVISSNECYIRETHQLEVLNPF
jgi:hypothetical protein